VDNHATEPIHHLKIDPATQKRLAAGHLWIYRNELEYRPTAVAPGDLADIEDHRGRFVGRAYINPHSIIAARVLTRERLPIDQAFFTDRIRKAQAWRERIIRTRSAYRVVHGEADGLPGLIVDRYGDAIVLQILTAGMERRRGFIVSALQEILHPRTIVARNDSTMREREGLIREAGVVSGEPVTEVSISLHGLHITVDLMEGQKTGLFLDQFDNYRLIEPLSPGAEVLDGFCYVGLWALHAARFGAWRVTGIDQSTSAIRQATTLAKQNGLEAQCAFQVGNVFDDLKERDRRRESFDLIILDPPAFVKSRARLPEAIRGYKEINLRALRLLRAGGFLITCSCSHHLSAERFQEILLEAAYDLRRPVKLLARRGQGPDHPVVLGMPETEYLKCFVLEAG
jgi:23S rRNA (cytosine1962-C5)-methyltransferase